MPRGLQKNSASLSTKHNTVTHRAVSFDCTYRNSPVSSPSAATSTLIEDRKQLVEYLESGSKPPSDWRIGPEHEKFGFRHDDLRPLSFDGAQGSESVMGGLADNGWKIGRA